MLRPSQAQDVRPRDRAEFLVREHAGWWHAL
jgi:hypothetical protein